MEVSARYIYPPVGRCIYCGSAKELSEEHIIPYALDGHLVLPKASCGQCAAITTKFEQTCSRDMFGPLRIRLDLQTRRKKQRPKSLKIITFKDFKDKNKSETKTVPSEQFPRACIGLNLPPPGIILGQPPTEQINLTMMMSSEDRETKTYLQGNQSAVVLGMMDFNAFFRLLAKIAHAFAVARLGLDGFKHRIPPLLVGKPGDSPNTFPHLVGGDLSELTPESCLHVLDEKQILIQNVPFRLVTIRLFAFMGMPRYQVVVGEDLSC